MGLLRSGLMGMALAAVLHTSAAAQAGRVIGRVTDGAGNAVADAKVALVAENGAAPMRADTTGETGGFEFARVTPGTYTLRVERAGYRVRELRVDLAPDEMETLIARLGTAPKRERLADDEASQSRRPR
jgi:hypothetical protein